jgi:hypothetical protein
MTSTRNAGCADRSAARTNRPASCFPCPRCGIREPCPGCGGCECNCSCWTPFAWARYRALVPDPLTERAAGPHPATPNVPPPTGGGTGDAA